MSPNTTLSMLRSGCPVLSAVLDARSDRPPVFVVELWPGCTTDVVMIIGLLRPTETDC